jgi:hypothetical protein
VGGIGVKLSRLLFISRITMMELLESLERSFAGRLARFDAGRQYFWDCLREEADRTLPRLSQTA